MSFTDPAPHAYPALQFPVHDDTLSPDSDPYRPASHSPLQLALVRPQSDPYRPALQFVQTLDPAMLYFPGTHCVELAATDPARQTKPALHGPTQDALDSPESDPYRPASHSPLQLALVRPHTDPYRPALQLLHSPAPDTLYFPGPHISAVSLVEPAAHAYPAKHTPEHDADDMPAAPPKRPALHTTQLPAPDSEY